MEPLPCTYLIVLEPWALYGKGGKQAGICGVFRHSWPMTDVILSMLAAAEAGPKEEDSRMSAGEGGHLQLPK